MKNLWIGALVLAMAPAIAMADRGARYHGGGGHYDRGERYYGRSSGSSFGLSFGYGSSGYHGDYSYANVRYNTGRPYYGYSNYCGPSYRSGYYVPAPVYVAPAPVYVAPPAVYYPARTYYHGGYAPRYYSPRGSYYYNAGGYYCR